MTLEQKMYERYLKNANTMRNNHLMRSYGINLDKYKEMYEAQGGVCDICGGTNKDDHNLAVDHDKMTGKVRGLLCRRCNSGLGYFKHNLNIMKKVIEYLEKHDVFALPIVDKKMQDEALEILQKQRENRKTGIDM